MCFKYKDSIEDFLCNTLKRKEQEDKVYRLLK